MSQATPSSQTSMFTQWMQARLGRRGAYWIGGSAITLAIVLFVWFLFQPSGAAGSPGVLARGQQAPNFTLANTAGKQVSLSQFQGHAVIVNFWSTTCGPCQSETPLLQRTLEQHQTQGLVVLGVDQGEEMTAISQFGKSYDLTYPLLADTHLAVNHQYGVTGLPVSYFIDGKGTIRAIVNGVLQTNTLQDGLASIGVK